MSIRFKWRGREIELKHGQTFREILDRHGKKGRRIIMVSDKNGRRIWEEQIPIPMRTIKDYRKTWTKYMKVEMPQSPQMHLPLFNKTCKGE